MAGELQLGAIIDHQNQILQTIEETQFECITSPIFGSIGKQLWDFDANADGYERKGRPWNCQSRLSMHSAARKMDIREALRQCWLLLTTRPKVTGKLCRQVGNADKGSFAVGCSFLLLITFEQLDLDFFLFFSSSVWIDQLGLCCRVISALILLSSTSIIDSSISFDLT